MMSVGELDVRRQTSERAYGLTRSLLTADIRRSRPASFLVPWRADGCVLLLSLRTRQELPGVRADVIDKRHHPPIQFLVEQELS